MTNPSERAREPELLACPFCGGEAGKLYAGGGVAVALYRPPPSYGCSRCQFALPSKAQWNTRALTPTPVEAGSDPVEDLCTSLGWRKCMDRDALERWRQIASEGDGHDMASVNKNTLFRLIGTIDALAALSRSPVTRDGVTVPLLAFAMDCAANNPAAIGPARNKAVELLERLGVEPPATGLFYHSREAAENDAAMTLAVRRARIGKVTPGGR